MCKAHSKATHIKQQKYFHHLKGRGYNNSLLYPGRLRWWKYICCFVCVTLLWALKNVKCLDVVHFFQVHTPTIFLRFSQKHGTRVLCIIRTKLDFFSNFAFRIFGQFLIFFQTANSSYSFFSDSDEIWHTRCMYQCTKNYGTDFQNFDCEICCTAADRAVSTDRPRSSVSYSSIQK